MPDNMRTEYYRATIDSPIPFDGPIVVDLDGTLVRIDTLPESWILLLRRKPLLSINSLFCLLKGRSFFKSYISTKVQPDASLLPYRAELVSLLKEEASKNRPIFLVTGADQKLADSISDHLGFFELAAGSSNGTNLTGSQKLAWIQNRIGDTPFVYAGDSSADNVIWQHCKQAIPIGPAQKRAEKLKRDGIQVHHLPSEEPSTIRSCIKLLRPHHWVKNLLVFASVFLAHRLGDIHALEMSVLAFAAMCMMASSFYIFNDLFDIEADRLHKRKRSRPLASGAVSISQAAALLGILFFILYLICLQLPSGAVNLVLLYGALSAAYSFYLKQFLFMDVLLLAGMFTMRILVGGQATGIVISEWTLAFSLFIFLSLALIKRMNELKTHADAAQEQLSSRGYLSRDSNVIASLGAGSSYTAVLILFLYANSERGDHHYTHPERLWLIGVVLIYWLSRFWILSNRGYLHDDPIVFAYRDRASIVCAILILAIGLASL